MTKPALPSIGIYQPLFRQDVRPFLDPGFLSLDWLDNPEPALRELALHGHIARTRRYQSHGLTGVFSPKFFSKTGLRAPEVMQWIAANPGHDVYCINGRPFLPYTGFNTLARGERMHGAEFQALSERLRAALGLHQPEQVGRQTNGTLFHCNYWCATADFWRRWHDDIIAPIARIRARDDAFARGLFAATPYRSPTPVSLIVFIYERLLVPYLAAGKVRSLSFRWRREQILGLDYHPGFRAYLDDVIPWVDELDESGTWTAAERERLEQSYDSFRQRTNIEGHEASVFDPNDFDLPGRRAAGS